MNIEEWLLSTSFGMWVFFLAFVIAASVLAMLISYLWDFEGCRTARPPSRFPRKGGFRSVKPPPDSRGITLQEASICPHDARCPVCQESLEKDEKPGRRIVACRECRALHHAKCFDYMSTCSMYGCPGTRRDSYPAPIGEE